MSDTEPFARFFYEAEKDKTASLKAGRDVFKQAEYISITFPGRKDFEFRGPATEDHLKRFHKAYEAFKMQEAEPESGTPLKMVPIMSVDAIAHLATAGIKTLEAFTGMTKQDLEAFPSEIRDLHKRSLAYLEAATDKGALAGKYARAVSFNEALEKDLKEARDTITDLKREVAALTKLVKKAS